MPRLVVRKSSLSTTHYCRRWILGNSVRTPRKKKIDADEQTSLPHPGPRKEAAVGLIAGGIRLLLRKCTFVNRARFVFAIFLVLFSTFTFMTLTDEIDATRNLAVQTIVADAVAKPHADPFQPQRDVTINVHRYRLARPNCTALAVGDKREIAQIERMLYKETQLPIPNSYFKDATKNCTRFRLLRNYPEVPHSDYEAQRPVAYLVGVREHAEQVERLMRAIYSPQNVYCLYSLNQTSSSSFADDELATALSLISGCFLNVIVKTGDDVNGSHRRRRRSSRYSAPYQDCLDAVLAHHEWTYLLMTTEGDFPLATNREIVDSIRQAATVWRLQRKSDYDRFLPPLTARNDYSGYMITRRMAALAARGLADDSLSKMDVLREIQLLDSMKELSNLKIRLDNFCDGLEACVLKSSDLQWLMRQPFLFARKFDLQTDYVIVGCLEAKLQSRLREESRNESFR